MKIRNLRLENYRGASALEILFNDHLTVLVGKNGSGKSSVLDAAKIMLSWFVAKFRSESGKGNFIDVNDIKNSAAQSVLRINCELDDLNSDVSWTMVKTRPGRQMIKKSDFGTLNEFAKLLQSNFGEKNEQDSIPLIAFYPVDRAVLDIPLRIRGKHQFSIIEAYEAALAGSANFRLFFEWFRNREDIENEMKVAKNNLSFSDPLLSAVRNAIERFMPGFSGLSVKRSPLRMEVSKNGEQLLVNQLSVGEKCLLAMVGDLARRLAIANPNNKKPLEGSGIILIDEIDLHLHPAWQRSVIKNLTTVFPNCQFIVSTHSPQILGEVVPESIRMLTNKNGNIDVNEPIQSLGLDASEILTTVMDTTERNSETLEALSQIFGLIDQDRLNEASKGIENLKTKIGGSIPEIVRAETMISLLE